MIWVRLSAAILVLLGCLLLLPCVAEAADEDWYDATTFEIEGKGWSDTESVYDRLPAHAKGKVPEGVWGLSKHSAGLCVRFQTAARTVSVRWDLTSESLAMPHMPATGVSGVDLYRRTAEGSWQFVQNGRPTQVSGNRATFSIPITEGKPTELLLYLPLYNGVKKLEIGVPAGTEIGKAPPRPEGKRRPLVFYGTSIVQGGCASRPGMAHVAILGRQLDWPVINLGFSGSGRMEPAVAEVLASLEPALYIIDCLWNISNLEESELTTRMTTLVKTIRAAHPSTPILFVGQSQIHAENAPSPLERLQEKVIRRLRAQGVPGLHLCAGKPLLGNDGEGTVDSVHPNDLGMKYHADALAPVLRALLPRSR